MKVIIDRFEGEYAVVEISESHYANLPKILIPNAREGDVINISINKLETDKLKNKTIELMNKVFDK